MQQMWFKLYHFSKKEWKLNLIKCGLQPFNLIKQTKIQIQIEQLILKVFKKIINSVQAVETQEKRKTLNIFCK